MTVLTSLLSAFRRSRSSSRKTRGAPITQQTSTEALEPRLLLTNPDFFSSRDGAPVTFYLDFDGHTENDTRWTTQRNDNVVGAIVTPAFDLDGQATFSDDERDRIQEIYERVAEDFRPFNVNITTDLTGLPAQFRDAREMLISVGGNGSWTVDPSTGSTAERYRAQSNTFDTDGPRTAFTFQTPHNGLGGADAGFEQNIAASISQAIAVSLGLQVHQVAGSPLEGDLLVAPILGDQIPGNDVPANPISERDIWYDAPGSTNANQDDLAQIVSNANVSFRQDDHGDTDGTSTALTVDPQNDETISGVIERNTDLDVFSITTAGTTATFSVVGLDLTNAPFNAANPGSNLDPTLTIRDASGAVLDTQNDAGLSTSITLTVPDGQYFIEVSNAGEYGNLGEYTLTVGGVNQLPAFSNPVALESKPDAPVDFYLAFAGDQIEDTNPILANRIDGASGPVTIAPYDTDGSPGYSPQEVDEITEIWARVAEDFRPFNVNVTTIRPGRLGDGIAAQVTIGDDGSFLGVSTYDALLRAYSNPNFPNQGFVFSENTETGFASDAHDIAFMASSAFGKMLGLRPHPQFIGSQQVSSLDPGNGAIGPILGNPRNSLRDIWVNAPSDLGAGSTQDDIATIAGQLGFVIDDHANTISGAATLSVDVGDEIINGIISETNDVDVVRFNTLATTATISLEGLDLRQQFARAIPNPGSNLDPVLELLDANGVVIASDDFPVGFFNDPEGLKATITQAIPAGTFYIRVSNRGEYGNLGEYNITLQGVDANPLTVEFQPDSFSEIDGLQTGVGIVRRPAGELFGPVITVDLVSNDTSEVTVQPQVIIPGGASFATFDITIVDDVLLDGDQRVPVTAFVNGTANGEAFVTVRDYETVTATVSPNPVAENVGTAQLTITRSNTDTGAPNHWTAVNSELREYAPDGTLVRSIAIEWPPGTRPVSENSHDITVLEDGRVAIYNGTATGYLSVFNPSTDQWNHIGAIAGLNSSTADLTIGGISSSGNFVFLTDVKADATDDNGLVRVDVNTGEVLRFGDRVVGARIFAMANGGGLGLDTRTIYELDPTNGALLGTINLQRNADAITFDGTNLWVVIRGDFNVLVDEVLKIDPDTGLTLETHPLGALQNTFFEGVVYLDGLLYIIDSQGPTFLSYEAYNPETRQVEGGIRNVEIVNGGIAVGSYFGSLPGKSRLLATDEQQSVIYEIEPATGAVLDSFVASQQYPLGILNPFLLDYIGSGPGITAVRDVIIGGVTYDELIYVHSAPDEFDIYAPDGTVIDADPSLPGVNPLVTEVTFSGDISGDDVPGVLTGNPEFRDVTVGFDGFVYALDISQTEVSVYNATSLARVKTIALDRAVRTIAVADSAGIYGGTANGEIVLFDFNGVTQSVASSSLGVIVDIEVNIGQEILLTNAGGQVLLTDQDAVAAGDLSAATLLENTADISFVSFGRHPTKSTGNLIVSLQSDDDSELILPATVTIPVNQQSITIDVQVVDDHERDGDQTVTVIADSAEYVAGVETVIVSDVENVAVEVLPDEVVEGSGVLAGQVRVYRTDVDGPLDFAGTVTGSKPETQPIADNAITLSRIVIEDQISHITDLNVSLSISHDAIPDLDVFLISPSGTRVELFTDLSSNESNLTNTTLDDEASQRIVDGSAPYTGLFIPEQFLANFDGENPSGVWTLEIIDDSLTDAGLLLGWSLDMTTLGLSELTVTLSSSDNTEASVPVTVTIPSNQFEIFVPLEVFDDDELDGPQTVIMSVMDVEDIGGFPFIWLNDSVEVTDSERLTISLSGTIISEGATSPLTGTVTRGNTGGELIVNLASSDTSELSVPAVVTIPDGEASVTFDIDAVNDSLFDGDQPVTIGVSAPGYVALTSEVITVQDQEPRLLLSTLTPVVAEDAGTITFTVTRRDANDLSLAQHVALTSSDVSELTVPESVIIPLGEVSTSFQATVVEDSDLDGTQTVIVTATDIDIANPSVDGTTFEVSIEDAEFVSVTVPVGQESILENAGSGAITVTVSVSSIGHTAPIVVTLSNSDLTEISIPASVVIPVDSSSTTFQLDVLDDPKIDRDQLVTLTGSVAGHRDGTLALTVLDHEPPVLVGPEANTVDPTPVFAWAAVDGATRYDLWVNDVSRNINQLFRLENRPVTAPLFKETFEAAGGFDEAGWTSTNADVDDLAINEEGSFSAHLNGNPDGGDRLLSRDIDLTGQVGVQLTYSFQRTGTLDSPGPAQDLVLQYRNADGNWIELERQLGVEEDMTVFQPSVVTLPGAALHAAFAFRFVSFGDPGVDDAGQTVDDWFVDDIILAAHESFEPAQELGVGHYRYWVRAYDDLEQPGVWSTDLNFRVRTAPVFTNPIETVTIAETTFPQISWTSVVDTARYDLWINNVTTGETQVVRQTDLQTTSFASATANLPGGTYRAWVRAFAPDLNLNDEFEGVAGGWSSSVVFTVLSTPQNITPSGATFDRTPEIRWDAVEGATNYDLWVTHRRGPGDNPVVLRDRFVSGTSRTPDTDFEVGSYVVWVRAIAEDGSRSQWSDPVNFTVGGRAVVTAPAEGAATSGNPVITWTGIEQTDFYQIWINNSAGERVVFESNVRATSLTVADTLPGDSYRVWVRAISEMGEESFWSNPVSFTVVTAATEVPGFGLQPSNTDVMLAKFDMMSAAVPPPVFTTADEATVEPQIVRDEREIPVEAGSVRAAIVSVATEGPIIDAVDSVMAEWDGADWWNAETTENADSDSSMAAAALGFLAVGTTVKSKSRRRSVRP